MFKSIDHDHCQATINVIIEPEESENQNGETGMIPERDPVIVSTSRGEEIMTDDQCGTISQT